MDYAPARYQFRSELEFQTAMDEWLAENEPFYRVTRFNHTTLEWEQVRFDFLADAVKALREAQAECWKREDVRKPDLEVVYPSAWGNIPGKYLRPGESPQIAKYAGCPDHLPGGSRDDYRMAGYRRY